jgi:hypothetical protein
MKTIGLLLILLVLFSFGNAFGCSGEISADATYRYEWDTASGGVAFKTGTGTWDGTVELNHLWDILQDKPFTITMDLTANSDIPYIDSTEAKSWFMFWCSSMVQETQYRVQKVKFSCIGYPYFPYDVEIFYLVPLSLNGRLIPEGSGDDRYYRLDATLKGLSQGVMFMKARMKGRIYPGWEE